MDNIDRIMAMSKEKLWVFFTEWLQYWRWMGETEFFELSENDRKEIFNAFYDFYA